MKTVNALIAVTLLTLSCARFALAENGVIADHVPGGADPAIVIAVVKQALINRDWKIEGVDTNSVKAKIDGAIIDANVHIFLSDGRLLYDGDATRTMKVSPTGPVRTTASNIPKNWIAYLRREIGTSLALMPDSSR
jgi:hypothetical protein